MKTKKKEVNYKSPLRKLVIFFKNSRDNWKKKYQETKKEVKRLTNRVRFLEKSKNSLKNQVKKLEMELKQMKKNEGKIEREVKKIVDKNKKSASKCIDSFDIIPSHHKYSVGHMMLYISLVLSAAISLRGASRAIEIFMSFLKHPQAAPSWYSGRLWLLRLGYYKLMQPKEKAKDWVWIIDHTVQLGAEKCLLILGIRLSYLPCPKRCVNHEDVEPIALYPVTKSNGEIVYEQLEQAIEKTGIPREIVSDHGSDLKAGIEKFCREHKETCFIYDIKHKTASILKKELKNDEAWSEFSKSASQTKRKVQQTDLFPFSSPNQRTKARYMNTDILIKWGRKILNLLEKRKNNGKKGNLEERFGWVKKFDNDISEWEGILRIMKASEKFVRKQGIYNGIYHDIKGLEEFEAHTGREEKVRKKILAFAAEQEMKVRPKERLLGSSEVIESVFGKFKYIEKDQAKSGFTGLLLGLPAIVSKTTKEVLQKTMETVPVSKISEWYKKNIGQSAQSRRREKFAEPKNKMEQKWDQFQAAG